MVEMRNQGTTYYRPTSDNVVTSDDQGYAFGMVAKYAIQNRKGSKNPEETKFSRGGWSSATRIVTGMEMLIIGQTQETLRCHEALAVEQLRMPMILSLM